jgi:hypothetical protein
MKTMMQPRAKNKRISYAFAPLTRLSEERGLSGALQRLQRGSHPILTTRSHS